MKTLYRTLLIVFSVISLVSMPILAQGVTTANMNGLVQNAEGEPLIAANVIVVHEPSGTQYGASTSSDGRFFLPNLKIGGPYTVTVSYVGYNSQVKKNIDLKIGQKLNLNFTLTSKSVKLGNIVVTGKKHEIINSGRTGAETFIDPASVQEMPSIKRSTRDLTRLDPRSDGNFSFGGRNWLYNNFSIDGSYFNNPYGLDDPAPGGQANAEPIPFDAVEQVQVSIAPFDVREGGFTGAGINIVTKSGTNKLKGSLYSFLRNASLIGNKVRGKNVIANPDLSFNQTGFYLSGPLIKNKLFFFVDAEIERREDPGTNFVADRDGNVVFGESRVRASVMDSIRQRMISSYGYDPGPYQGYINRTKNEKFIAKIDWNINENNNLTFRYNRLDARRDLGPHPFVLSFNNTGRGPNKNSLPFRNSGYRINNRLNSFALELNSRGKTFANKFFASYNKFKDFRDPFSRDFPTIEIGVNGVNYTTLGHEPFSIHNKLDQEVIQITNNYSMFVGDHVFTIGANFEKFKFFNSFNIFRDGVFFLPAGVFTGARFSSLAQFFALTDPNNPNFLKFNSSFYIGSGPYKGETISVGQLSFYAQDEYFVSKNFNIIYGVRVDIPQYYNTLVDNPFSRGLTLLNENDRPETVDQSKLPGGQALFSPRIGFNWDVNGNSVTQIRGGTGIFTGRLPFVWVGNNISNPGQNPNLPAYLRSYDLNAMAPDFKWPQVWTTNIAIDHLFDNGILGTFEFIYGKDINAIYVRNADLVAPVRTLPDGRPYYGGAGNNELNPDGGAGVYVIDNTDKGYNYSFTAQLRKNFDNGIRASLSYTYLKAKNVMKTTEIASVLWQNNPVKGDPNKPQLSDAEFGNRHRIIGGLTYKKEWSNNFATSIGVFLEIAEGNRFTAAGGNRYSFIYSGDVNGDGQSGNDLIYIPRNQSEINFDPYVNSAGKTVTAAEQWAAFNRFISQDNYLNSNRGKIADRFGEINPWFSNIDMRILQDFSFMVGSKKQTFQLSIDILNVANLINSDWGVRKVANTLATSPLELTRFNAQGEPVFNYKANLTKTFIDDPNQFSRWRMQVGLRYMF
ncbi:MAG TPA: TonB-dependent receptor [Ignavibacteria bacterium]|nr:TonB-dependent receptor [Ignavibacteria bacterium]